jgi:hypothetical protein
MMHGVMNLPIELLIGTRLIQLCFGQNEVVFHFAGDIYLTCESQLKLPRNGSIIYENFGMIATELCGALGCEVDSCTRLDENNVLIEFANSLVVQLIDESKQFESIILQVGDKKYIA